MRFFLIAVGTSGDVFPFIGLGRELQERGHVVHMACPANFRSAIEGAGLTFRELPGAIAKPISANSYKPVNSIEEAAKGLLLPLLQPVYEMVSSLKPREWIVIAHPLCFGARLSQERNGTSVITAVVSPFMIRSLERVPVLPGMRWLRWAPMAVQRVFLRGAARLWDKQLGPGLNAYRQTLGLAPVRDIFYGWAFSPEGVVGLFPEWFSPRASDWPPKFVYGGFTTYDRATSQALPADLELSGRPLVVFAAGSSGSAGKAFFSAAVKTAAGQAWDAVLLTGTGNSWEGDLPPNVRQYSFIPLSVLLPKSRLLVHHGGLGSASLAFEAGVPQLVLPFGHDQFDNAHQLERLQVGRALYGRGVYDRLPGIISKILRDPRIAKRAEDLARVMNSDRSLDALCAMLETTEPAA